MVIEPNEIGLCFFMNGERVNNGFGIKDNLLCNCDLLWNCD